MQMPSWMPEPGSPLDRVATFLMANLFWVACAVFLITLPAGTAALFATLAPWARGRDAELFATFFGTLRRQWLKSTVIFVATAAILAVTIANIQVVEQLGLDPVMAYVIRGVNLFVALTLLMVNIYMWPLLVLFDLPLRRLISVSIRMALGHPFWSLLVLILAALPVIASLFVPVVLAVLAGASTLVTIVNWGAWRIIRLHASPEELAELDTPS
jgi:uncharacterized membrane protein YesL